MMKTPLSALCLRPSSPSREQWRRWSVCVFSSWAVHVRQVQTQVLTQHALQ